MSFRTGLLPALEAIRTILGPTGLDMRLNQVSIAVRTWSGKRPGDGTSTDSVLALPQHYPVRHLDQREVAESGGTYEYGDILVDHITPSDGDGTGYMPSDLKPTIQKNQERVYIISGTHPGEYTLVELRSFKSFSWQLVLRRRVTTP